jgi:hypothetical protein
MPAAALRLLPENNKVKKEEEAMESEEAVEGGGGAFSCLYKNIGDRHKCQLSGSRSKYMHS